MILGEVRNKRSKMLPFRVEASTYCNGPRVPTIRVCLIAKLMPLQTLHTQPPCFRSESGTFKPPASEICCRGDSESMSNKHCTVFKSKFGGWYNVPTAYDELSKRVT